MAEDASFGGDMDASTGTAEAYSRADARLKMSRKDMCMWGRKTHPRRRSTQFRIAIAGR
jgi:hypothetical protein